MTCAAPCAPCRAGYAPTAMPSSRITIAAMSSTFVPSHRAGWIAPRYWWLAYDFGNYLLACSTCNSEWKRDRFPLEPGAVRVGFEARAQVDEEQRLLIDPVVDPVERWMKVDWTDRLCCMVYAPQAAVPKPKARLRAEETIASLGLNRTERMQLLQDRVRICNRAMELFNEGTAEGKVEKIEELRRLASRYREHGMTVRAFLEDFADEVQLPSAEEELEWLLEDVDELLRISEVCLRRDPSSRDRQRLVDQLRWMLAVLWKDPPTGSPEGIARWLDDKGWREMIEPLYRKLTSP